MARIIIKPILSDIISIAFLIFLSVLDIIFIHKVEQGYVFLIVNIIIIFLILYISGVYYNKSINGEIPDGSRSSIWRIIRYWYPIVLILYIFKQVYFIIYYVKPLDWDQTLIQADRWLFGTDPTVWTFQFAHPFLTEFLQIIYFFYYISIVIYALELYLNKRFGGMEYATFVILTGFYISYIGYLIFPAIGPRFYIHDFHSITNELPGLLLTEPIRWFLNLGESIPTSLPNPQDYAQRDAMPSAHTIIALILAYLSHRIRSRSFYFYLPYAILMIISTVYLRYHYVIDIIAGIVLGILSILIANYLYRKYTVKPFNFDQ